MSIGAHPTIWLPGNCICWTIPFYIYPALVHELSYERASRNLSVHGYQKEGTITTPFDTHVQNEIDRYHLVKDALYSTCLSSAIRVLTSSRK